MKFTIIETKELTAKSGAKFAVATLKNEREEVFSNVTLFAPTNTSKVGETITGELTPNDYNGKTGWKFKQETTTTIFQKKAGNFVKAMETKAENIKEAQERKNDAIKLAGLQRDAVLIVTTFYKENFKLYTDEEMERVVKNKIEEWKEWLDSNYGDVIPF